MSAQPEYIRPSDIVRAAESTAARTREGIGQTMEEVREEGLGGGITVALDPIRARDVIRHLFSRQAVNEGFPRLAGEWLKVALGISTIELPTKDVFYGDPVWHQNRLFRRLAQAHLAFTEVFDSMTKDPAGEWTDQERAAYINAIVTGAFSPANFLPTNPVALRQAIDTRGRSLVRGLRNMLTDLTDNKGMPSMVDSTPFTVGGNLAITPGSVIYREEMFEILQYKPQTEQVHARPLLFVPPQVNKAYVLDLAPGRSMIEYAVQSGLQTFMLIWRNPRKDPKLRHGSWSLEDYLEALARGVDVIKEITGSPDVNAMGLCAGGMTTALLQAIQAQKGDNSIAHATYVVTMLDARKPNMITWMATPEMEKGMERRSEKAVVIDSKDMAANFAWMRPKDLVYNYVINNWLLGNEPPVFDVLAWNDDATNVSATFSRDLNTLMANPGLYGSDQMTLLDTPIDLKRITNDVFVVAGQRDHITTWRPCYMTTQLVGGDSQVVIVNSGHIQTFVNPVKGSRYKYWTGKGDSPDPDEWIKTAEQVDGSWWPAWREWTTKRSGPKRKAPATLGSRAYPPMEDAPGVYVHEK